MEQSQRYREAKGRLNDAQREAVEHIHGPVVVFAGPGTGKTQILTLRIAEILEREGADLAPNILALTFTNAGVRAMRERLSSFIGPDLAYRVPIHTFHSFAQHQIESYPEFFPQFQFFRPVSQVERYEIVEEILRNGSFQRLINFHQSFERFIPNILSAIDELKQEGIDPDQFEALLDEIPDRVLRKYGEDAYLKRRSGEREAGEVKLTVEKEMEREREKQEELLRVYRAYQEKLRERERYDFADMILSVVTEAEKEGNFLTFLREQYLYLLVDEHQDTNRAQNRIVELIADAPVNEGNPNLFVVGDEKQAIYRFQGASHENFLRLQERYRGTKVIHLGENYRSTQDLLDLAHRVIPAQRELISAHPEMKGKEGKIRIVEAPDWETELSFIAADIAEKQKAGVPLDEIAVFARTNRELIQLKNILDARKIPATLFAKENILGTPELRSLVSIIRAIAHPDDDAILARALFSPLFKIPARALVLLFERKRNQKGKRDTFTSLYRIASHPSQLKKLKLERKEEKALEEAMELIGDLHSHAPTLDALTLLKELVERASYLNYLAEQRDQIRAFQRFERFFDLVRSEQEGRKEFTLADLVRFLDALERYHIRLELPERNASEGVSLMTAHGAKGLEFSHVYLMNLRESVWGKAKKRGHGFLLPTDRSLGDIEDERRLFYVAITRAKESLTLTYAERDEKGREGARSPFIQAVEEHEATDFLTLDPVPAQERMLLLARPSGRRHRLFDPVWVRERFLETPLSVSALNNYFQSPILYLFRNLIRVPSTKTRALILGDLVHDALKRFFSLGKERNVGKEDLLRSLEDAIEYRFIPVSDFQDITERAREILSDYYDFYHDSFRFDGIEVEQGFRTPFVLPSGEKILLKGFIDKVERLDNGELRVIDYKTGKPMKRKRKEEREALIRQLRFYKLLVEGVRPERVREGVLDFVERDRESGTYAREILSLSEEDRAIVAEEIQRFAEDILSGAFLEREYTREELGEYADLWETLRSA